MALTLDKKPANPQAESKSQPNVQPLIEQVLAGKKDAFDEIVFLYRDQVYATCWHLTRNAEDAMDVTQEVFVRAYRALNSYKGNARFSTWLHRIVLNTSIDYVRRERKHRKNVISENSADEDDERPQRNEGSTPARQRETVYNKQIHKQVMLAISSLSGRQREVFLLRYYQDLPLREVAEIMRCSEGAVKRHLHRAHERLRELLKDIERS